MTSDYAIHSQTQGTAAKMLIESGKQKGCLMQQTNNGIDNQWEGQGNTNILRAGLKRWKKKHLSHPAADITMHYFFYGQLRPSCKHELAFVVGA